MSRLRSRSRWPRSECSLHRQCSTVGRLGIVGINCEYFRTARGGPARRGQPRAVETHTFGARFWDTSRFLPLCRYSPHLFSSATKCGPPKYAAVSHTLASPLLSDAARLFFYFFFAAMVAAQVPPLHVRLAPMRLLGVMLASVTLALFYCRCSLLLSLLSASVAAQVPPLHVQLAPMRLLGVLLASVTLARLYSRCSPRRGRRPRCRRCTSS